MQRRRLRMFREEAPAVAESQFLPREKPHALLREQRRHTGGHLFQLPAVSPGVHAHAAAHGSGDAVGKFQPRQPLPAGEIRQTGQGDAAPGDNGIRLFPHLQAAEAIGPDDQPVQSPVRGQQVRAVADDQGPGPALPGHGQQQHQLLALFRERHPLRGTTHPEGGMLCHGLLLQDAHVR